MVGHQLLAPLLDQPGEFDGFLHSRGPRPPCDGPPRTFSRPPSCAEDLGLCPPRVEPWSPPPSGQRLCAEVPRPRSRARPPGSPTTMTRLDLRASAVVRARPSEVRARRERLPPSFARSRLSGDVVAPRSASWISPGGPVLVARAPPRIDRGGTAACRAERRSASFGSCRLALGECDRSFPGFVIHPEACGVLGDRALRGFKIQTDLDPGRCRLAKLRFGHNRNVFKMSLHFRGPSEPSGFKLLPFHLAS